MFELFANPGFLAVGGALVSAPIIIHLINRMRFKRLRWAAMEFLLKSQKRNRRRLIIEQLLLLMLRCLLVALATFLVSRFAGFSFGMNQAKDILHIVLVDDTLSLSDQFKESDTPRNCFLVAKEEVGKIAKGLAQTNRNDRLVLMTLSKIAVERNYQPKTYNRLGDKARMDELKSDLDAMEASKLHVDMLPGVKKAQDLAANNLESQVHFYIVSDFRHSDWSLPGAEGLQQALVKLAKATDTKVRLMDTAHPYRQPGQGGVPVSHDNIGIVDLRAGTRVAGKGMPVTFTVTVANYSAREAQVNVAVFDDGTGEEKHEVGQIFNPPMPLKIAGGSTASATFELRFNKEIKGNQAEFAQISARLESPQRGKLENDGLPGDNVRHAAVEIRNKVPVLVIDGEGTRGRSENHDSFFIKNAIISVPGASYEVVYGDELGGGVATKALERSDLLQYPTIFLLNVRELAPKQLTNLENYVREGGGVAFFMGPLVSSDYYNKNLYKKGKGIFPAPLRETYFPSGNEEPRKPEYDDYHVLLRDKQFANMEMFPIFGPIFQEGRFRELLKDLPVKRYFQVPRADWRPEAGKVDELATLPNDQPIGTYRGAAFEILKKLDKILQNDDYQPYRRGLDRHRKIIEALVDPTSEKKAFHLATALENMLLDKGKEKDRADYPNLTEFWTESDPKIRTLREAALQLADEVRYGDPFVVLSHYGKGKVVAIMTTAGKEWNDWGGGSDSSLFYQPFIWELQNYLSSQGSDSYLTVGTPVQVVVDSEQFKQKNRTLKMLRYFYKTQQGNKAEEILDSDQFGEEKKGELTFTFEKNLEPGLYVSRLVFDTDEKAKSPLASWGHVFNVDTPREGKLQRVSQEDMEKNFLREAGGAIIFDSPQRGGDDSSARPNHLSDSPWFFLLFLGILVAEHALAVHLSFHLRGAEGELPGAVTRVTARAA